MLGDVRVKAGVKVKEGVVIMEAVAIIYVMRDTSVCIYLVIV